MSKKSTKKSSNHPKDEVRVRRNTSHTPPKHDEIDLSELKFKITDDAPLMGAVDHSEYGETTIEHVHPRKEKRTHTKHYPTIAKATLLVACLLMIGTYFMSGWTMNKNGSLSAYQVGDTLITKQNASNAEAAVISSVESFKFSIRNTNGKTSSYTASEAGLSADAQQTIANVLEAQSKASLFDKLAFWKTFSFPVVLKTDETKLANFIDGHLVKTTKKPKNATLHTETGSVVITKERDGKGITIANPEDTLNDLVANLRSNQTLTLSPQSLRAKVTTSDLQPLKSTIEAIGNLSVTVTIGDTTHTAAKQTIISWVDPVQAGATDARLEINSGKVTAWIEGLAASSTAPVQNQVIAKNSDGSTKTLTAGRNGTEVGGAEEAAARITDELTAQQSAKETLSVISKPFKVVNVKTYDKWLLADLTNHMLYAYEKDKLVRSLPMSAGAPETPTVVGQYNIYAKVRSQTMVGPNVDGSSYSVPNVEWVSYFYQDYAIHGNYWRPLSTFGSANTSHGCIGLINSNSEWVYNWAPIGTPVITYN